MSLQPDSSFKTAADCAAFASVMLSLKHLMPVLLLLFLLPFSASAQFIYSQKHAEVDALLEADGSLKVTDTRHFEITGLFDFLPVEIKLKTHRIELHSVKLDGNPLEETNVLPDQMTNPAAEKLRGVYYADEADGLISVFVFDEFVSAQRKVTLEYTVSGAVVSDGETAFLSRSMVGSRDRPFAELINNQALRNRTAEARLRFAIPPADEELTARSRFQRNYRPLMPEVSGGEVNLGPDSVFAARALSLELLMPASSVPDLPGIGSVPDRDQFIREYDDWTAQLLREEEEALEMAGRRAWMNPIGYILLIGSFISFFMIFGKPRRFKKIKHQTPRLLLEPPGEVPLAPGVMLLNRQLFFYIQYIPMLASPALIDLARRGYFQIGFNYPPGVTRNIHAILQRVPVLIRRTDKPRGPELRKWEILIMDCIEAGLAGGLNTIQQILPSRKELRRRVSEGEISAEEAGRLRKDAKAWGKMFEQAIKDDMFFESKLMRRASRPFYWNLMALLFALLMVANQSFLGLFLLIVALAGTVTGFLGKFRTTEEGYRATLKWTAYRKALTESEIGGSATAGEHLAASASLFFSTDGYERPWYHAKEFLGTVAAKNGYDFGDADWVELNHSSAANPDETMDMLLLSMQWAFQFGVMRHMPRPVPYRRRVWRK